MENNKKFYDVGDIIKVKNLIFKINVVNAKKNIDSNGMYFLKDNDSHQIMCGHGIIYNCTVIKLNEVDE